MVRKYFGIIPFIFLLITGGVQAATVDFRIIETTDLHGNMMDFDYYKDQETEQFGFVRTATLIHQAREEVKNSVLVDNGDIIQGSPMADYIAEKGLNEGDVHPVYKALNSVKYTVGGLGNHEFNYGLDYLHKALAGAQFPYINSNVYNAKTNQPYFTPYVILDTPVVDREGKEYILKVGYISFVPPQIMRWDKKHLDGKVYVIDIIESAQHWVPILQKEGADIIIAIPHSGISKEPFRALMENSVYYLTQVPGIHAVMFGHSHAVFPSKDFADIPGVDLEKGLINGIPSVMPGQWGDHLGIVDLVIEGEPGNWKVTMGKSEARAIYDKTKRRALVDPDMEMRHILEHDHEQTRHYVGESIGQSAQDIYNYLVMVQDDYGLKIVSDAQRAYLKHFVQGDPDLDGLPILSTSAPFRAGGRKNDPNAYVEINKGEMTLRNAADLYVFSNLLVAIKVNGEQVKEWLECSSGLFNQIDVTKKEPQSLINWTTFRSYLFDVIDGVQYQIDVTQPPKYDGRCNVINPSSERIKNLTWQGKSIPKDKVFLMALNDYRAYTHVFPGTGEENVVVSSPDMIRSILIDYVRKKTEEEGQLTVSLNNTWEFTPIKAEHKLDIRFETSPSEKATNYVKQHSKYPVNYVELDSTGYAVYQIDLQNKK